MPLAYVAWRAGTTYWVVVPVRQAGNRFLGSSKRLQIRALVVQMLPRQKQNRLRNFKVTSKKRRLGGFTCYSVSSLFYAFYPNKRGNIRPKNHLTLLSL
jgi:hypothetical protein